MLFVILGLLIAESTSAGATDIYRACIDGNARAFLTNRDVVNTVDAALTQCEPFLPAAATELKGLGGKHALDALEADYRRRNGHDPDINILLADLVRGAGRSLAEQIVANAKVPPSPSPTVEPSGPVRP